jgi:hypothetical protein
VVLLDGDGLREIRLAQLFDRLRERRGGLSPRLCLATDFVGYEALIGSLSRNDFFRFPRALVDVEYQGVHQSVTVRTRQPHHWIRKDNSGRRHLHAPGGLDAVLTPVYSGTFSRWFLEGTDHACVTTLADWQDPDQDFVSAGLALARGAELLVSLVPRRAGAPGASPFEKDGRVVLMEDGEVDPGLDRRLAHGRADVLSLKALFARMGLPWDQPEREEKVRAFVNGLRGPPEVVRRAVEEAAVIRQVRTRVDQFVWPYSRLTSRPEHFLLGRRSSPPLRRDDPGQGGHAAGPAPVRRAVCHGRVARGPGPRRRIRPPRGAQRSAESGLAAPIKRRPVSEWRGGDEYTRPLRFHSLQVGARPMRRSDGSAAPPTTV